MINLRLLQVETNQDDASLVCHELMRAGFEVFARRVDSAAGLRIELASANWDLVVADYAMPGFTGTSALGIVREQHPELPFIFVSRVSGEDAAVSAMRTGADDYVMKGNLSRLGPAVGRELREAAGRHERQLANQRVAYLAYHDSLTDLPNRALFHDRLQQALLRSHRDENCLALLLIDLDGFKEINDSRGHHAGDLVLQEVATRLRGALRASDTVARLGGDEFGVLLPATDVNRAEQAARKVLQDLAHPIEADGHPLMVSASIGIASAPVHAATGDELLQKADAAMYLAKNAKCGYQIYNAARDPRLYPGVSMATALRQAIDQQQFEVDYQPIVHLQTGVIIGIESLVRWNHPQRGRLLPDDFIRVAEQTGLVNQMTGFVLERALSEWPVAAMPAACAISVNVSPRSLHHAAFPGRVSELLETYRMPAGSLALELTENLVTSDPEGSARCLRQLHEMGVTLAIDDYGRGYSSLSYLHRLPVDQLKIDRSLLISLADGEDDRLVRCMIDLAHNLGMQVVAAGVETGRVYQQLVDMGCDAVQGYHVCRPVSAAELARWIEQRPGAD